MIPRVSISRTRGVLYSVKHLWWNLFQKYLTAKTSNYFQNGFELKLWNFDHIFSEAKYFSGNTFNSAMSTRNMYTCTVSKSTWQTGHPLINGSLDDAMNMKHGYFWRQFLVCNSLNVNFQASYEVEISILWIEEKGMVQFTEQNAFLENSHIIRLMKTLANFVYQSVSPV